MFEHNVPEMLHVWNSSVGLHLLSGRHTGGSRHCYTELTVCVLFLGITMAARLPVTRMFDKVDRVAELGCRSLLIRSHPEAHHVAFKSLAFVFVATPLHE